MAYQLPIGTSTLYNWRKYKPELYHIVMLGFKFDEPLEQNKKNYEELQNINNALKDEIEKFKK